MKDIYILGIESSCDETSVSIVKNGYDEICTVTSTQIDIHKKYGGVVPEIASRNHIKVITMILEECLNSAGITMKEIDAISVTYAPGLIGSLLIGLEAAKTLSYIYNKPLVPVNHIAGHIYANNLNKGMKFPLIALVVSGGHTELILMKEDYNFKFIGATLDDAVGEVYDKVARVLNLEYPGGPLIDKLAKEGQDTYELPLPKDDKTYDFSFSGLKSAVINLVHNEKQRGNKINSANMARSFQNRAVEILTKKTMRALNEYNITNLVIAGGVSANSHLRERFEELTTEKNINLSIPAMKYCTDNATMIAAAGYYAYKLGKIGDLGLKAKAVEKLYDFVSIDDKK